jgi:hypothetical protein
MVRDDKRWWQWGLIAITLTLCFTVSREFSLVNSHAEYLYSIRFKIYLLGQIGIVLALHAFTWIKSLKTIATKVIGRYKKSRWISYSLLVLALGIYFLFVFLQQRYLPVFSGFWFWLLAFSLGALIGGILIRSVFGYEYWKSFSLAGLFIGAGSQIIGYFPYPLSYPFTLNWSETSWFYYASFFFSQKLYHTSMPWPFLDIGRPLLLSAAYLVPNTPIWLIRIWQYFLFWVPALIVAFLLNRRLKSKKDQAIILILWGFMWVLQGAVLYHLSFAVILILWGFDRDRFWKTIIWVAAASLWTGILRINWLPVPGIVAISLYLLETPVPEKAKLVEYLRKPLFYAIFGLGSGIASFAAYLFISGRADTRIGTKFTAPFLTERLWPNATLATGIIPGILLVSLGVLIAIFLSWRAVRYHPIRIILLLAMLIILLVGGMIASIRIGGGDNLHNLDAYLVLLMIWGAYAITGNIRSEEKENLFQLPKIILLLIFLTPVLWTWQSIPPYSQKSTTTAYQELASLQQIVQTETHSQGKPALFVYQRHLITFGYIDTPLVTEYELEELTEMAISGKAEYFNQFYADLAERKYSLIILDNSQPIFKSNHSSFSEEDNAWVKYILIPVGKYYHPVLLLPQSGTEVYAPNP